MCRLSKCVHITGVGLVSLPEAKVSEASRKLKSFGTNGLGMGTKGRIASRSKNAVTTTARTAKFCFLARRPKVCSTRAKYLEPSRGAQNATANASAVSPHSITTKDE